jgi:hypothetical protein
MKATPNKAVHDGPVPSNTNILHGKESPEM